MSLFRGQGQYRSLTCRGESRRESEVITSAAAYSRERAEMVHDTMGFGAVRCQNFCIEWSTVPYRMTMLLVAVVIAPPLTAC